MPDIKPIEEQVLLDTTREGVAVVTLSRPCWWMRSASGRSMKRRRRRYRTDDENHCCVRKFYDLCFRVCDGTGLSFLELKFFSDFRDRI